ncbi:fibronectin type III domain-containing protein 10 [Periophthalmus magnuspinnatus]|uniref:fibronectin type III domain-containing protein 10 n=1 Tax=Periophthalmus magnuspinnatus TaxID=409849 RepID=UPI002436F4DF|nr:fibronectin type III domain-containing protein 10 [Periophthalmus magnuspinnatus]
MKRGHGQPLLALWALFLHCTSQQTASSSSSSQVSTRVHMETPPSKTPQIENSFRNDSQILRRPAAGPEEPLDHMLFNTSRATVMPERSPRSQSRRSEDGVSPLCAYRVIEGGVGGQVCFRHTLPEYKCQKGQCRTAVSSGNLVANILINGSVLLQWTQVGQSTLNKGNKTNGQNISKDHGTNVITSPSVVSGRRHRRGGFELSCWWNGSYTQFECTGVQLAHGCRDYLLTELHENIPYRFCLHSLDRPRAQVRDCVEFTLPPSGMQDIVIAMTTVGGAICVMLVIICLLVAYITENIMSPTTTHTYSYRSHSCH